ncbi:MAG: DUF4340 domain-containing protein [Lachnospiraceae bacterium]|nr:DUF4340 domain-containing protein [Lachnospiraceae bacterium]
MKKQKGQMIIMLAVLLVLGVGYLALRQYNKVQSEKEPEVEGDVLVSLEKDDIIRFSFDYEGTDYTYEKEDGTWYYAADNTLNLTQTRLNTMAGRVADLTASNTITGVTDLAQYGLDEPSKTFTFDTGSESFTFNVGDYNDMASVYYICEPGSDTVYTVSSITVTQFNFDVTEIVEEEESTEAAEETESGSEVAETEGATETSETETTISGTESAVETETKE